MSKIVDASALSPAGSFSLEEKLRASDDNSKKMTRAEKTEAINAIVQDPRVTLETFAHLDLKKILLKIDLRLIPPLTALYLLSFLDRGNIGNAKIEGLSEDLHLTPGQSVAGIWTIANVQADEVR